MVVLHNAKAPPYALQFPAGSKMGHVLHTDARNRQVLRLCSHLRHFRISCNGAEIRCVKCLFEKISVNQSFIYSVFENGSKDITARLIYNGSVEGRDVVVTPETAGIRNLPESPGSFTGDMKRANANLKSCLFLSSTLTTDGNFSAFRAKTGSDFREGPVIPSTLPWHRAILWVPKSLPSPREDERRFARLFASFCSRYVPPFVKKDLGGVLILCTSLERMRACANALRASLDGALLVQGELPKRETMRRFLSSRSPVLVSSSSFREGFDAPGKKLTWVIMDRLPFASPEDEETNTTAKLLREWGLLKNPFDHGLDMMKLALRQSIGRLIRSPKDYGAITVLDSRTLSGKWNIDSAIPVPKENVVSDFLAPDDWIRLFQRKLLLF